MYKRRYQNTQILKIIIEYFKLEGLTEVIKIQVLALHKTVPRITPCDWQSCPYSCQTWWYYHFLGDPVQCLVKVPSGCRPLFIISNRNVPWHNFRPLPQVLSLVTRGDISASPSSSPYKEVVNAVRYLLQAEQIQWPQPSLTCLPSRLFTIFVAFLWTLQ